MKTAEEIVGKIAEIRNDTAVKKCSMFTQDRLWSRLNGVVDALDELMDWIEADDD